MNAVKIFRALVAISFVLAAASSAGAVDFEKDDKVIWLSSDENSERTLDVTTSCSTDRWVNVTDNGNLVESRHDNASKDFVFGSGSGQISVSDLGNYTVKSECENGNTDSREFHIAEMNPKIIQPVDSVLAYRRHFMGSESEGSRFKGKPVKVNLSVEGLGDFGIGEKGIELDISDLSFTNTLPDYSSKSLDSSSPSLSGDQVAVLHPYVPSDVGGGYHKLKVNVNHDSVYGAALGDGEDVSTSDDALYITGVRTQSINPSNHITRTQLKDVNLDLLVEKDYQGYVSEDSFILRIDDSGKTDTYTGVFNLKNRSGKKYSLDLVEKPSDLPGKGSFQLEVLYEDPIYSKNIEIASYNVSSDTVYYEGYVWGSNSQPVQTSFEMGGKSFSTDSEGFFSEKFSPGSYNFRAKFGSKDTGSVNLKNVELKPVYSPDETVVRYEYKKDPSIDAPGVKPLSMMALVFRTPFQVEGSTVKMDFEVLGTGVDPTEVSVLSCDNWDIEQGNCLSRWKKVPENRTSRIPSWSVEVPVEPFQTRLRGQEKNITRSAYVVGTRAGLTINGDNPLSVNSDRISLGEKIKVTGQVMEGARGVKNARVKVTMSNGAEKKTFTGKTDSDGVFKVSGKVPESPGNYTIEAKITKKGYDSLQTTRGDDVWVYREESMELGIKSGNIPVYQGRKTRVPLTLENTGDTTLDSITLSTDDTTGLSPEFFSYLNRTVERLEPGEKKQVKMLFNVPENCGSCDSFPRVEISAEGTGEKGVVKTSDVLNLVLKSGESSSASSSSSKNKDGGNGSFSLPSPKLESPTGEFFSSSINMALGLVLVFLMVLAGALKKKQEGDDRRGVMMQDGAQGGSRTRGIQKIKPSTPSPVEDEDVKDERVEEMAEALEKENSDEISDEDLEKVAKAETGESEEEEGGKEESAETVCDTCGEEFDTESGLKLHRQAMHD